MRFKVYRTSDRTSGKKPPCESAMAETITHKSWDGETYEDTIWTLELATLQDLVNFAQRVGSLVLIAEEMPLIEIYDYYRE